MTEVTPVRSSVVQVKIGNRTYDMVQNRNCATCMHPARFKIESRLLQNYGYTAVSRYVSELNIQNRDGSVDEWPELSPAQIRMHYLNGHCPVEGEIARTLAEQRAQERGIDLKESSGQYLDHVIVQNLIFSRGYELLVEGKINPDVKDLVALSKIMGDQEGDAEAGATEEQWQEFMSIYFNAVQAEVSQEQWRAITKRIREHPVFNNMNKANNEENQDGIVEAEIVEEQK